MFDALTFYAQRGGVNEISEFVYVLPNLWVYEIFSNFITVSNILAINKQNS